MVVSASPDDSRSSRQLPPSNLLAAHPALAADAVPPAAKQALAPVEHMIGALVAITIGLGVALSGAVIVWGGIEKTLAGSNADAEHWAQERIQNGIHGLVCRLRSSGIVRCRMSGATRSSSPSICRPHMTTAPCGRAPCPAPSA